ncbi:hypothetical protein D5086_022351 [Populus alba]|uniref:Uncharacterized protein n=1 Tax=Populus alba TaxID=43335 RepID=A0ACC4BGF6_POPAL
MPSPPQRITATGGASANQSILNSRASIFGGDVRTKTWSPAFALTSFSYSGFSELDSSPDGCENFWYFLDRLCIPESCVRADHGWLCNENGSLGPFASLYGDNLENSSLC